MLLGQIYADSDRDRATYASADQEVELSGLDRHQNGKCHGKRNGVEFHASVKLYGTYDGECSHTDSHDDQNGDDDPQEMSKLGKNKTVAARLQNEVVVGAQNELLAGSIIGKDGAVGHDPAAIDCDHITGVCYVAIRTVQGVGVCDIQGATALYVGGDNGGAGQVKGTGADVLDRGICHGVDLARIHLQRAAVHHDRGGGLCQNGTLFGCAVGHGQNAGIQRQSAGGGQRFAVQVDGVVAVQLCAGGGGVGQQRNGAVPMQLSHVNGLGKGRSGDNGLAVCRNGCDVGGGGGGGKPQRRDQTDHKAQRQQTCQKSLFHR